MAEILIPKFPGRKNEFVAALEEEHRKFLAGIVEKRAGLARPYYVLIFAKSQLDGKLRITARTSFDKPAEMLGTVCYRVDNLAGKIEREWVLPLDIPMPDHLVSEHSDGFDTRLGAWNIVDDALRKGMPLVYGAE